MHTKLNREVSLLYMGFSYGYFVKAMLIDLYNRLADINFN